MSLPLSFHPEVENDVKEAYRWYEKQKLGLGDDFFAAIEAVYDRLQVAPQAHQAIFQQVRRALPRGFPYAVLYRVLSDRIEILAVLHTRRNPSLWQSRI